MKKTKEEIRTCSTPEMEIQVGEFTTPREEAPKEQSVNEESGGGRMPIKPSLCESVELSQ